MPTIQFTRATNPTTSEVVHINPLAVLYVEAAREHLVGKTLIQVIGQTEQGMRVTEALQEVLAGLPDTVPAYRHYHAGSPNEGESVVHICAHNIASIVPNAPSAPLFWTIAFKDQSVLRIMAPLPPEL